MKAKTSLFAASLGALLLASGSIASATPTISFSSEKTMHISSARVVRAIGGGSYVTGMAEPSFGYTASRSAHVHISVYDADGNLLAEKTDKLNRTRLVRWHLNPHPRAGYVAFFPWTPAQIAKVIIVEHSDNTRHAS